MSGFRGVVVILLALLVVSVIAGVTAYMATFVSNDVLQANSPMVQTHTIETDETLNTTTSGQSEVVQYNEIEINGPLYESQSGYSLWIPTGTSAEELSLGGKEIGVIFTGVFGKLCIGLCGGRGLHDLPLEEIDKTIVTADQRTLRLRLFILGEWAGDQILISVSDIQPAPQMWSGSIQSETSSEKLEIVETILASMKFK